MAGHSHWANIKHKKAANDAKKAKVITQQSRLIKGAIMVGGPDPDMNPRLRLAITKARAQNMSNEAIARAIDRFSGATADKPMEELTYEGYGPGGVAIVVDALSDNRTRTAPEVRKLFERGGGTMGAIGCVAWQFHDKATFLCTATSEDAVMEALLAADADADDIADQGDGRVAITGAQDQYERIATALKKAGIAVEASDLTRLPETTVPIADPALAQQIQALIDALDDHDDVTAVYSNFAPTDEAAARL